MIPKAFITEWSQNSPWISNNQIEQDLIIERALVEIFSDKELSDQLAFRGGTALHKLFLKPAVRYSEDIDLVQLHPGEIGPLFTRLRQKLNFLGNANYKTTEHNATLIYRFDSEYEPVTRLKLKIEINTREHFHFYDLMKMKYVVSSSYFSGDCLLITFSVEELLATKLRALYQRSKGRDLFDIYYAHQIMDLDFVKIINAFNQYISKDGLSITSSDFISNLSEKINEQEFSGDIIGLLRPDIEYNQSATYQFILKNLLSKL